MPYAISNKKNKKWLYGTDYRYSPPHQRLSDDTPYLYPTQLLAELALKARRCNADYEIVKVNVEPVRHGKWDYVTVVDEGFWRCSNCGTPSEAIGAKKLYKYCPFCGADMRGEKNERLYKKR